MSLFVWESKWDEVNSVWGIDWIPNGTKYDEGKMTLKH